MMRFRLLRRLAGALGLLGALAAGPLLPACGGVGEEGTGASTESVSVGLLKGLDDQSVTVNGIVYQRGSAQIVDGFGEPLHAEALRLGQWLEVQGQLDGSGTQGVAQRIRVRPAARGVVISKDPGGAALSVLDTTVRIVNGTVLDSVASAAGLAVGDTVEVHGPIASASAGGAAEVNASRIERLVPASGKPFELRGRVSQLDTVARTFTLGRRTVSYATANVTLRSALVNGLMVRVSAAAGPVLAQVWHVDRLAADQPLPDNVGFVYTEGYVDALAAGPLFSLEDLNVDARNAGGRNAVDANGLRVAVVGSLAGGTLVAKSVAVIEPGEPVVFTLSAAITDFVSAADFKVRGVAIDASGATYVAPATPAALANGVRVRLQGTVLGRKLIATQVVLLP